MKFITRSAHPSLFTRYFHSTHQNFTTTKNFITLDTTHNIPFFIKVQAKKSASSKEILIVEDNAVLQLLYSKVFENFGYTTKLTANALNALQFFTQCPDAYDLIVIDVGLPDMNGIELSKLIRQRDDNIPIIILTAYDADEIKDQCCNVKINHIATKPISLSDLEIIIQKILQK